MSSNPDQKTIQAINRRARIRALVQEALALTDDYDFPIVRYDLAHADAVLACTSDQDAVGRGMK